MRLSAACIRFGCVRQQEAKRLTLRVTEASNEHLEALVLDLDGLHLGERRDRAGFDQRAHDVDAATTAQFLLNVTIQLRKQTPQDEAKTNIYYSAKQWSGTTRTCCMATLMR